MPPLRPSRVDADPSGAVKPASPLRQIAGHVAMTGSVGTAWYRLAPVSWSFRPDRDRESHLISQAVTMALLTGQKMHFRGTTTPFPVRAWAEQHHNMVVAKGRPFRAEPLPCWPDLLEGEQRQFLGEAMREKEVFLGVDFLRRSLWAELAAAVAPKSAGPLTRELKRQQPRLTALDTLIGRAGINGTPLTAPQMAWLLHRSTHLGFPAPARRVLVDVDQWDTGDLADLLTEVSWTADPFATTLKVTGIVDGRTVTRHVAILTVGRMQPMTIPQRDLPWMTIADPLGIPLEWSAHVTARADKDVLGEVRMILNRIAAQTSHYEDEHGMDAPSALQEQREQALEVEAELTNLADSSLSRAKGWWRVAVSGATAKEALVAAERVIAAYGRRVDMKHTYGQHDLAGEFLPGGQVRLKAHMRKLPLRAVAAGGAAVTSMAGDRRGWNIGRAAIDNSPACWDPWRNTEEYDVSGLYPIVAGLGGGKSNLLGMIVGKTGAAGIPWCVIDPAARLGRLGRTRQLRAVSRNLDMLAGQPGSLNPYKLVREPQPEDFGDINLTDLDDTEAADIGLTVEQLYTTRLADLDPARVEQLRHRRYRAAVVRAAAIRTRLCMDSLLQILPASFAITSPDAGHVMTELRLAAQAVADPTGRFRGRPKHPGLIIEALRESKTTHRAVAVATADMLASISQEPQPALLFPTSDADAERGVDHFGAQLTFLSTKGIVLPDPDIRPEFWADEARQGVAILNLTSWLALRWMYSLPSHQRKGVGLDEIQFLNAVPSGRLMLTEFARNTRKQNAAVFAAGQDPGDTLLDTRGGNNFVGGAFIGRMDDQEAAARALRMAQIPTGVGYENTLLDLPKPTDDNPDVPRQFLFYSRGGDGFREVITVSRAGAHLQWIWEALESAPGQEFTGAAA